MLGLAWSCDWLGCGSRMVQAYGDGWGRFNATDGFVDGVYDLADTGWSVGEDCKVWCPVHALVKQAQGAAVLELRPNREMPAAMLVDVRLLAERYVGGTLLRVVVDTAGHGRRTVGIGPRVEPDAELIAALLEYGTLVVVPA
jgi:hypothetical protein